MSDSISAQETILPFPWGRAIEPDSREQTRHDALTAELQVARAREKAWLREKSDLLRRQDRHARGGTTAGSGRSSASELIRSDGYRLLTAALRLAK